MGKRAVHDGYGQVFSVAQPARAPVGSGDIGSSPINESAANLVRVYNAIVFTTRIALVAALMQYIE